MTFKRNRTADFSALQIFPLHRYIRECQREDSCGSSRPSGLRLRGKPIKGGGVSICDPIATMGRAGSAPGPSICAVAAPYKILL